MADHEERQVGYIHPGQVDVLTCSEGWYAHHSYLYSRVQSLILILVTRAKRDTAGATKRSPYVVIAPV